MKVQTALIKLAMRKEAGLRAKILGALGLGAAAGGGGYAGYQTFRNKPSPVMEQAKGMGSKMLDFLKTPAGMATAAGLGLLGGYGIYRGLSGGDEEPQRQMVMPRPMSQTIPINIHTMFHPGGIHTQKYSAAKWAEYRGFEKNAGLAKLLGKGLGAASRFVGRATGISRGRAVNRAYNALNKSRPEMLQEALAAQRGAGQAPGLLSTVFNPIRTMGQRFTKRGRMGWIAEQAAGNTKAWQRMMRGVDPAKAKHMQATLSRFGKGISARTPGIVGETAMDMAVWSPLFITPAFNAVTGDGEKSPTFEEYAALRKAQHDYANRPISQKTTEGYEGIMAGLADKIGDNPVGNWVAQNPYLAGGVGLAAGAGLGYGLYRLARGGRPQYGYSYR